MVFSKISELFSPGLIRLSASNKSPGLPIPASPHGLPKPEKRSNLRLSYSLQDLSTYRRLDIEEGNQNAGVERNSGHALPPYIFEKEKGAASFSMGKLSPGTSYRKKRWITEPGFDKLVQNISGLQKAIKPLIEWVKSRMYRILNLM